MGRYCWPRWAILAWRPAQPGPIRYRAHHIPCAYSAEDFAVVVLATGFLAAWMIRGILRPHTRPDQVVPALSGLLARLQHPGDPAIRSAAADRRATERKRRAIADTGRELRTPLSVLSGLIEYYRHRDQLRPADFHRLLGRVVQETVRIDAIIGEHLDRGLDEPGPPG